MLVIQTSQECVESMLEPVTLATLYHTVVALCISLHVFVL